MRLTLLVLPALLAGCPKQEAPAVVAAETTDAPQELVSNTTVDGLTEVQVDMDRDGRAEITNYYRESATGTRLLLRKSTDLDRDGRMDVFTEFDETGIRIKETYDGDFDGRPDCTDHFIAGKRTMSEIDTDFNGTVDMWKFYESGVTRRKERDTNGDGRTDVWEYLDPQGAVTKVGRDQDGDGRMDTREE